MFVKENPDRKKKTKKTKQNKTIIQTDELGEILLEDINKRSMVSSRVKVTHQSDRTQSYKFDVHDALSLKAAHFQVNNTKALSYLMKMSQTENREMTALAK